MIKHALTALRETVQSSTEPLSSQNCAVSIVGLGHNFTIIEDEKLKPYLATLDALPEKMEVETAKDAAPSTNNNNNADDTPKQQ